MAVTYADDGYIKAPLSVGLHALAALKDMFHDDAAFDFNMFKTNILVKGISAQAAHAAAHRLIASHLALNTFSNQLLGSVRTTRSSRHHAHPPTGRGCASHPAISLWERIFSGYIF